MINTIYIFKLKTPLCFTNSVTYKKRKSPVNLEQTLVTFVPQTGYILKIN